MLHRRAYLAVTTVVIGLVTVIPTLQASASPKAFKGRGLGATPLFTIPASAKGWRLNWGYSCPKEKFGLKNIFTFWVYKGDEDSSAGEVSFTPESYMGTGASTDNGTMTYWGTGTFKVVIESLCFWTFQPVDGP